jgi:hypothetical protein
MSLYVRSGIHSSSLMANRARVQCAPPFLQMTIRSLHLPAQVQDK